MEEFQQLKFSVRYRLGEYVRFVSEHAFMSEQTLRELTGLKRRMALASLKIVSTVMFLYKSARVGQCHFTIDSVSISRRSKGGDGTISWSQVKAVHAYSPGYMIETETGAMPIPSRVLSAEQLSGFRLLAARLIDQEPQPSSSFKPDLLRKSASFRR